MALPEQGTPLRKAHAVFESNAVKYNLNENRRLLKNLQILNQEEKHSLTLMEVENKDLVNYYKRLRGKVEHVKTNLNTEDIANMRRLEAAGKMKGVYQGIQSPNNSKIAAQAKLLQLNNKRPKSAIPIRNRSPGRQHSPNFRHNGTVENGSLNGDNDYPIHKAKAKNKHEECDLLRDDVAFSVFTEPSRNGYDDVPVNINRHAKIRPKTALVTSSIGQKTANSYPTDILCEDGGMPEIETDSMMRISLANGTHSFEVDENIADNETDMVFPEDDNLSVFDASEALHQNDKPPGIAHRNDSYKTYEITEDSDKLFSRVTQLNCEEKQQCIGKTIQVCPSKTTIDTLENDSPEQSRHDNKHTQGEKPKRQLPRPQTATVKRTPRETSYGVPTDQNISSQHESKLLRFRPTTSNSPRRSQGYEDIHMPAAVKSQTMPSFSKNRRLVSPRDMKKKAQSYQIMPTNTPLKNGGETRPATAHHRSPRVAKDEFYTEPEAETPRLLNRPQTARPNVPSQPVLTFTNQPIEENMPNGAFPNLQADSNKSKKQLVVEVPSVEDLQVDDESQPVPANSQLPRPSSSKRQLPRKPTSSSDKTIMYTHPPLPGQTSGNNQHDIKTPKHRPKTAISSSHSVAKQYPPQEPQTSIPKLKMAIGNEKRPLTAGPEKRPMSASRTTPRLQDDNIQPHFQSMNVTEKVATQTPTRKLPGRPPIFPARTRTTPSNSQQTSINGSLPSGAKTEGRIMSKIARMLPRPTTERKTTLRRQQETNSNTISNSSNANKSNYPKPMLATRAYGMVDELDTAGQQQFEKHMQIIENSEKIETPNGVIKDSQEKSKLSSQMDIIKKIAPKSFNYYNLKSKQNVTKRMLPATPGSTNDSTLPVKLKNDDLTNDVEISIGQQNNKPLGSKTRPKTAKFAGTATEAEVHMTKVARPQSASNRRVAHASQYENRVNNDNTYSNPHTGAKKSAIPVMAHQEMKSKISKHSHEQSEKDIDESESLEQTKRPKSSIPVKHNVHETPDSSGSRTRRVLPRPPSSSQTGSRADSTLRQQRSKRMDQPGLETSSAYFQRPKSARMPYKTELEYNEIKSFFKRPFDSHAQLEREEKEKATGIKTADDLEEELRGELLNVEKLTQVDLDGKISDFYGGVKDFNEKSGIPKEHWRGDSSSRIPRSKSAKFSKQDKESATFYKDRRKAKMLHNKEAFERTINDVKKSGSFKDIEKCQYLRIPEDRIDRSGVNTLATNQMHLLKTMKGVD